MMKLSPIITNLTDTDFYKFTMLKAMWHRHPDLNGTYVFKCRNKDVKFTPDMLEEINAQLDHLCTLTFTEEELAYLNTIPFLAGNFVEFLRLWRPIRKYVNCWLDKGNLNIEVNGPLFAVMQI